MNANHFQVAVGRLISSATSDYRVQYLLGSGTFGVVTQCKKLATNEMVAVKIFKSKRHFKEAKEEEMILKKMKEFDSHKFNIVRWNDSFAYMGNFCLEFEKLDISLHEFMQTCSNPLKLAEIRPIVQQLATALEFLMSVGIIHADLKLANIMMVEQFNQPLRVKIIDFGLASDNPRACTGLTLQTLWYRAPEVLLGCPINEAIDVWSLGCIAAEMLMGMALFPGSDEYDMMRHIFYTIGKPPDHLLFAGLYTGDFFRAKNRGSGLPTWRFMSALETHTCNQRTLFNLNQLEMIPDELSGEDASIDACERASFVDLLTMMLKVDASERITPSQILQHPFITMSHLVETFDNSDYVKTSVELMKACNDLSSDGDDVTYATLKTCMLDCHSVPGEDHLSGLSSSEEPILVNSTDDSECGNRRPEPTMTKTKRNEFLDAAVTETGGQTSPNKRDDADQCLTSDANSRAKKRRSVNVNEKLIVSVKKLLARTEAWSSSTSVKPHKRKKRAYEDDSDSKQEKTSTVKRGRRGVNLLN